MSGLIAMTGYFVARAAPWGVDESAIDCSRSDQRMNFERWLWSGLAEEARAAAEKVQHEDLQIRVLLDAARYKVLAGRAAESDDLANGGGLG
jgi:hypothetical protein